MSSINHRGWAWLDEDSAPGLDTAHGKAVIARADALMHAWSTLHDEQEQEHFARLRDAEDGGDWDDPRYCDCDEGKADDPDELCKHDRARLDEQQAAEAVRREGQRVQQELLEAELQALGVRPMRPYEHWNEDEAYMQYMEEGRFAGQEEYA